jgi:hypothetical protein
MTIESSALADALTLNRPLTNSTLTGNDINDDGTRADQ